MRDEARLAIVTAGWTAGRRLDYNCDRIDAAAGPSGRHELARAVISSISGGVMDRSPVSRRRRDLLQGCGAATALGRARISRHRPQPVRRRFASAT